MMEYWHSFERAFSDGVKLLADQLTFLGSHRWAATIVLLTLIVRTALLPLAVKQVRSSQAMQRLQPEIKRLQAKFKADKQKLNQETFELYKREGVNPFASCLPLIAQMPVFFAMFYAIRGLSQTVKHMPFLGLGNLASPASKSVAGILLIAIMTATSFLSTRQMTAGQDPMQARMMKLMPLMFVVFMINLPAGLVLYWATSNLYQYLQQTIMLRNAPKPVLQGKKAQPAARPSSSPRGGAPKARANGSGGKQRPKKAGAKRTDNKWLPRGNRGR